MHTFTFITHPHTHTHTHTPTHTDFAAMAGLDYTSIINMPIILSAGMQTIQIAVELINDTIFENNEMFQGILTIISGERVSLSPGTANATIIEDEGMYMYTLCCIFSYTHNYYTVEATFKFLFRLCSTLIRFAPSVILCCGFVVTLTACSNRNDTASFTGI